MSRIIGGCNCININKTSMDHNDDDTITIWSLNNNDVINIIIRSIYLSLKDGKFDKSHVHHSTSQSTSMLIYNALYATINPQTDN